MKKLSFINILGIIIASFCIVSCAKEKFDTTINHPASILGKWNLAADTIYYYEDGKLKSEPSDDTGGGDYVQFNANGVGTDGTTSFKYTLTGTDLTLYYPEHSIDNVHYEADTATAVVKILTAQQLFLHFNASEDGSYIDESFTR